MHIVKSKDSRHLFAPEAWLKLYPPSSAEEMLARFKKAGVRHTSDKLEMERFIREAYDYSKPAHAGFAYRAKAEDFGLKEGEMPYADFRQYIFGSINRGADVVPCAPWERIMTVVTLAETPAIYVPEGRKVFCISGYAAAPEKQLLVIESDHGWYWLHQEAVRSRTPFIQPDDWILFRA